MSRQLWHWYLDIVDCRPVSRLTEPAQMPDGRLGWQVKTTALHVPATEIRSWCELNAIQFEGWQLATIHLIDEIHVRLLNNPPAPAAPVSASDSKDKSGWLSLFSSMGLRKEAQ